MTYPDIYADAGGKRLLATPDTVKNERNMFGIQVHPDGERYNASQRFFML